MVTHSWSNAGSICKRHVIARYLQRRAIQGSLFYQLGVFLGFGIFGSPIISFVYHDRYLRLFFAKTYFLLLRPASVLASWDPLSFCEPGPVRRWVARSSASALFTFHSSIFLLSSSILCSSCSASESSVTEMMGAGELDSVVPRRAESAAVKCPASPNPAEL